MSHRPSSRGKGALHRKRRRRPRRGAQLVGVLSWSLWVAKCRDRRDIQSALVHGHTVPGRGKQSPLSQVIDALDFAEVRSERDADLLYQAKGRKKGQKMSAEEAA